MDDTLRILLALDFGPDTAALRHRVCALRRHHPRLQVDLAYALSPRELALLAGWGVGDVQSLGDRAAELAMAALQREVVALRQHGVDGVEAHLLRGEAPAALAALAAARGNDLLLAGSGNRMWRSVLLGSAARGLLASYPGALWLARGDDAPAVDRVAIAEDGSVSSGVAAQLALRLFPEARAALLHVLDQPQLPEGLVDTAMSAARREAALTLLARAAARIPGGGVGTTLLEGRPVAAIAAHLAQQPAGLLAVGRHAAGEPGAPRRLGATAAGLIEAVTVDLLVGPL